MNSTGNDAEPFSETYGYDYRAETERRPYVTVYDTADSARIVAEHVRYAEAYARYGDASWPVPAADDNDLYDRK